MGEIELQEKVEETGSVENEKVDDKASEKNKDVELEDGKVEYIEAVEDAKKVEEAVAKVTHYEPEEEWAVKDIPVLRQGCENTDYPVWLSRWNRHLKAHHITSDRDKTYELYKACEDSIKHLIGHMFPPYAVHVIRRSVPAYAELMEICEKLAGWGSTTWIELHWLKQQPDTSLKAFSLLQKCMLDVMPSKECEAPEGHQCETGPQLWAAASLLFVDGIADEEIRVKMKDFFLHPHDENMTEKAKYEDTVEVAMRLEAWDADRDCPVCCTRDHSALGFTKRIRKQYCTAFYATCSYCLKQGHIEESCKQKKAKEQQEKEQKEQEEQEKKEEIEQEEQDEKDALAALKAQDHIVHSGEIHLL